MKFIILCYPRTGSTLLITALGAHPHLRQGMELFNPELEGDDPWVHWRQETFNQLYGEQETYLNPQKNLDGERFDLSLLSREFFRVFDGTKIMYDQLDRRSPVWDHLRSMGDLRIIILRRNIVEAAVSFRIAMATNIWFVPNEKSYIWYVPGQDTKPPSLSLEYPLWYFDWFYNYYCAAEEFFVNLFQDQAKMVVNYEEMIANWEQTIQTLQVHLGVEPITIPMMFDKRTHGTIKELISNYDEIRTYYYHHPVLAAHFQAVSSLS